MDDFLRFGAGSFLAGALRFAGLRAARFFWMGSSSLSEESSSELSLYFGLGLARFLFGLSTQGLWTRFGPDLEPCALIPPSISHFGQRFTPIAQGNLDLIRAINHMMVSQYIAILADNDARSQAGEHPLMGCGIVAAEELPEEGV